MTHLIAIAFMALISNPAQAMTETQCISISNSAGHIMRHRQNEMDMTKLYKIINKMENEHSKMYLKQVIKMAYQEPHFSTDKYKTGAIKKFKNRIFGLCLSA